MYLVDVTLCSSVSGVWSPAWAAVDGVGNGRTSGGGLGTGAADFCDAKCFVTKWVNGYCTTVNRWGYHNEW